MRRFVFVLLLIIPLFLGADPLRADDTDLFAVQVEPDVLLAFDLSGSMGAHPGGDYSWASSCGTNPYYASKGPGHETQCDTAGFIWGDSTCEGPFYDWSGDPHTTNCSKLEIAKRAIFDILDDTDNKSINQADEKSLNIRFGYMRFKSCEREDSSVDYSKDCNTVRRGIGFNYSGLNDLVAAETNEAWTPLASQLAEAAKYLDDHKNGVLPAASAPDPAKACRKKFIVMLTDGWDTLACEGRRGQDEDTTGSYGYKRRRATVAKAYAAARTGYRVFVIGFGKDMPLTERNTLNWAALYGGTNNPIGGDEPPTLPEPLPITPSESPCKQYDGCSPSQKECNNAPNDPGYSYLNGYAFLAQDSAALTQSLKTVLKYIVEQSYSFTAPSIPSIRMIDNNVVYISSLIPNETPVWRGNLKAYQLDDKGMLPVNEYGYPSDEQLLWDAVEKLKEKSPDARKIYTVADGTLRLFTKSQITRNDVGVTTDGDKDKLIDHVRGYDPYDLNQNRVTSEVRDWKLGDIFHSTAVVVGEPNRYYEDECFDVCRKTSGVSFYQTHKNRTKMIVVGSNDGMLHFFNAGTGEELGAFIPPSVLKNLKSIKSSWDQYIATGAPQPILYFADGSPKVADVWFYSAADDTTKEPGEWKTVLVSGLRKGGKTYFALDITNPSTASQNFLWEFPSSGKNYNYDDVFGKIGQSWSDPAIGKVKVEAEDELYERWVAFIGGGYDATNTTGNVFFVVDLKTGWVIKEFFGLPGMTKSFAASPKAVDTNGDGYIDKIYVGDLGGQMWVFDVSFDKGTRKSNSMWSGKILFQAPQVSPEKHPIYYQPAVAFDSFSNLWVYFGTGERENPKDKNSYERFYAVRDDEAGSYPRTEAKLKNVTGANSFQPPPYADYKGWYLQLEKGEKVLAKPTVFHRLLYFTSYFPTEDPDTCTVGGQARSYVLEYLSGGGAHEVDELTDLLGSAGTRWKVIGPGAPSDPVITVNQDGGASVITGNTSGGASSGGVFEDTVNKRILYWREIVRK